MGGRIELTIVVDPGKKTSLKINLAKSYNWYDLSLKIKGYGNFEERYAGHIADGSVSKTDPLMGGVANYFGMQKGNLYPKRLII